MSEKEFYQWRLFYPFLPNDQEHPAFSLKSKLKMLSITDEKPAQEYFITDLYFPLENSDIALKLHSINQIELHVRNRHREIASPIEHWSQFELKSSRFDLPEKILSRIDRTLIERIEQYLHQMPITDAIRSPSSLPFSAIELQKSSTIWQMDDSDRQIEQSDLHLIIHDCHAKEKHLHIPEQWRTIAIQTSDHQQLCKTLTTFQLEEDKDLLDYFSLLIAQSDWNRWRTSDLSSAKAYVNLFRMSECAFIELIRAIHFDQ